MLTLREYIAIREQALSNQLEKIMQQETINALSVSIVNAQMTELYKLKVGLEDGKIEGI